MTKRIAFSLVAATVLTLVGTAASAAPLGLGLVGSTVGSAAGAVQPPSVVDAAGGAVGNEVGAATGAANHVVTADLGSTGSSSAFSGTADTRAVSADAYTTFENLVNDVQDGGGWHGDVVTNDAFSPDGVDGGVPGASIPFPVRIEF